MVKIKQLQVMFENIAKEYYYLDAYCCIRDISIEFDYENEESPYWITVRGSLGRDSDVANTNKEFKFTYDNGKSIEYIEGRFTQLVIDLCSVE